MKFILFHLTEFDGEESEVYVNAEHITWFSGYHYNDGESLVTDLIFQSGDTLNSISIKETPEQILKLIKEGE